ncbi:MAG TPA: OmpA family protein [Acidimicrobiia bacterium]|jgi:outer membrane protein OmpA-like peptidoglycan-associated protein|nr:OmpA family protein [Acidimicrobiia bacterium]
MGRNRLRLLLIATTFVLVAGAGAFAVRHATNPGAADEAPPAATGVESPLDVTTVELAAAETPSVSTDTPAVSLLVELNGGVFRISGVVPDAATAARLVASARLTYGPTVAHSIDIDPNLTAPEWLDGAAGAISLLPMITEGTIYAAGDPVRLTGVAPNQQYLTAYEAAVARTLGVSNIETSISISELHSPVFNARRQDGVLVLSGVMPTDLIRDYILGGAIAVYGAENVVDETTTDEQLHTAYWMYTMPHVFELFEPFTDYELHIENGVTSGSLNEGANFESGSAVLDESTEGVLTVAISMLKRDPSLGLLVEGHTDNVGSRAFNQQLSEARAQAAVDYVLAGEIPGNRVTAVGFGEDRPVATNWTRDGRAANRRIILIFEPFGSDS